MTDAITAAFFEELAAVGYGRLSVDAVAKRACVGKAAIYRRWRSKSELAMDLVAKVAVAAIDVPDTGTLRDDVRAYLGNGRAALTHPLARTIIPDLLAEATRNAELAAMLATMVREPRRRKATQILDRAIERGEVAPDIDTEVILDVLAGPLYWRQAVMQLPADDGYLDRLTDCVVALARATPTHS